VALAAVIYNETNPNPEHPLPDDAHKIFGFLVGFLLVFRSTIAHKRFTDGVAKLSAMENNSLELTRKVCMYCSEGSGGWKEGEKLVRLRERRDEIRRLLVQFNVLAAVDMMRDLNDQVAADKMKAAADKSDGGEEASNPLNSAGGEGMTSAGKGRMALTDHTRKWTDRAANNTALFKPSEVEQCRTAGSHFVVQAARNLEAAIFPLFIEKHFPHVNMLRECLAHIKALNATWSDCAVIAETPIPFPYVQLAKLFTFVFLFTLPFALVEDLGRLTVLAAAILGLGYLGLDAIATEMEQPFGFDLNDLPVPETVEKIEVGTRVLMSQLEGEALNSYEVRPFFVEG